MSERVGVILHGESTAAEHEDFLPEDTVLLDRDKDVWFHHIQGWYMPAYNGPVKYFDLLPTHHAPYVVIYNPNADTNE